MSPCFKRYKNLNGLKYHIEHAHQSILPPAEKENESRPLKKIRTKSTMKSSKPPLSSKPPVAQPITNEAMSQFVHAQILEAMTILAMNATRNNMAQQSRY